MNKITLAEFNNFIKGKIHNFQLAGNEELSIIKDIYWSYTRKDIPNDNLFPLLEIIDRIFSPAWIWVSDYTVMYSANAWDLKINAIINYARHKKIRELAIFINAKIKNELAFRVFE